jgi:predicted nucleic-acid-binding protein
VIGLDTNVIVRYLAQDDAKQSAVATRFIERALSTESPGYITNVTLCEVVWVLAECYGADRARIRAVLEGLLASKQLALEEADLVWKALRAWGASSADFSDALVGQIVSARGGGRTVTFDRAAAKLPGFELLR